jgi:DNA polymerase
MPIPLRYSGAHTHRFSGDWKINAQNLPRFPNDALRKTFRAPTGMKVVSVDLSQVEARLTATLAGQDDLVEQFRNRQDVYSIFASRIYNKPVDKETDEGRARTVGKHGILSLGYGASWRTFQGMVRNMSNRTIFLEDEECQRVVRLYRSTYWHIGNFWRECDGVLMDLADGREKARPPVIIQGGTILLPTGHRLRYNDLQQVENEETGRMQWICRFGRQLKYLYGAKLVENIVQALAFCVIMQAAVRIKRLFREELKLAHQVHDELIYVVPERLAAEIGEIVVAEVAKPPLWLPEAPLAAEVAIGDSYGDC